MSSIRARWAAVACAALPGVVALLAYRSIVHAWFFNDDFQILYELTNGDGLVRFLLGPMFGHVNTARNVLLAGELAVFGPRPAPFYGVALAIHVANAVLLQRLGRRLTGSDAIAAGVAVAWAASWMHAGTLTWCAAHGHALLATLLLALLAGVERRAREAHPLGVAAAVGWLVVLLAVATLYGVGFGAAAAFPVALLVVAPQVVPAASRVVLLSAPLVLLALFGVLHWLYPPPHTQAMAAVMPSALELLSRPDGIAALLGRLAAVGAASLALGPFAPGTILRPDALVASWAAVALVLALGAWRGTPRDRRWIAAALLLALAGWGVVALGRGVQWATNPSPNAFGERYQYAPQTMLALAAMVALGALGRRAGAALALGWGAVAVVGLVLRPLPLALHAAERQATADALADVRAQVAAAAPGAAVRIPNRSFAPMEFLGLFQGRWTFPGLAGVFVIFEPQDTIDGRRVVFVATDPAQLAARERGGRIAGLLVPP